MLKYIHLWFGEVNIYTNIVQNLLELGVLLEIVFPQFHLLLDKFISDILVEINTKEIKKIEVQEEQK